MSSVIFSGPYVKALRAGLNLFNNATIWSEAIDPSSVGFAAPLGDVFISTSTQSIYTKTGSGDTNWSILSAGSGANQALSNLTSPTAINQDLIFAEGGPANLKTQDEIGSPSANLTISTGATDTSSSGDIVFGSGAPGTANTDSGVTFIGSGAVTGTGSSGNVNIISGSAVDGASGGVALVTGSISGTGTRGNIIFADGSEGTTGYVWTSVDTFGAGHWAPAAGGTGSRLVELRTISSGEAAAKQLTLGATPATPNYTVLEISGAPSQFYGVDFAVSGAILSWSGLGLDGILSSGDQLTIIYN